MIITASAIVANTGINTFVVIIAAAPGSMAVHRGIMTMPVHAITGTAFVIITAIATFAYTAGGKSTISKTTSTIFTITGIAFVIIITGASITNTAVRIMAISVNTIIRTAFVAVGAGASFAYAVFSICAVSRIAIIGTAVLIKVATASIALAFIRIV